MIPMTPAVLRTLSEGLDRLNDGDMDDAAVVQEVKALMFQQGLVLRHRTWVPCGEVYSGFVSTDQGPAFSWENADGEWPSGHSGLELFEDEGFTMTLRRVP